MVILRSTELIFFAAVMQSFRICNLTCIATRNNRYKGVGLHTLLSSARLVEILRALDDEASTYCCMCFKQDMALKQHKQTSSVRAKCNTHRHTQSQTDRPQDNLHPSDTVMLPVCPSVLANKRACKTRS